MTLIDTPKSACPEPGVYPDVPAAEYHGWRIASATGLNTLHKQSPAHAYEAMVCPKPSTPAQRFGEAAHMAILQPDLFAARYAVLPEGDGRDKKVKEAKAAAIAKHGPENLLAADDMERIKGICKSVYAHPTARKLLDRRTHIETSVIWIDSETGVRCKLRSDLVCGGMDLLSDIKTTSDASPAEFAKSIYNFGYHRQFAHYLAGWAAHGMSLDQATIVAAEKEPPYVVAVYCIDHEAIEVGRKQRQRALEKWGWCETTGMWPGYEEIIDIGLPPWAVRDE